MYIKEIARLKFRHDQSSKLVADLKKEISQLCDKLRKKKKESEILQQELWNTKRMNLPIEKHGVQALDSALKRLKLHHLAKSRLDEVIVTVNTSDHHARLRERRFRDGFGRGRTGYTTAKTKNEWLEPLNGTA